MTLCKRLKIWKKIVDEDIISNGLTISQDQDRNIMMSMEAYWSKIQYDPDVAFLRAGTGRQSITMEG